MKNYLWLVALLPLLSGCESQAILVKKDDAYFAPPKTEAPPPADGRAGGVFETGYNWSLTADRRAYRVGDILTVILEESTQSSKQAKTNFGKNNTVDIGAPTIFGHTKDKLSGSIDANRDFDGSATSQQQNSLRGEITVSVHAVQPNGILEIRGEKWLTLNRGDEYIRLSGFGARRRYPERQLGFLPADRRRPHFLCRTRRVKRRQRRRLADAVV